MLEKKLNELPGLPKYVGKFDVEKLALGEATPKCNMLRPLDGNEGSNAPWDGGSLPGRGCMRRGGSGFELRRVD